MYRLRLYCHCSWAHAFLDAIVDGTDIFRDVLSVAAVNVEHHNLIDNVNLIESDFV